MKRGWTHLLIVPFALVAAYFKPFAYATDHPSSRAAVLIPQVGITEHIAGTPSISPDGRIIATMSRGYEVLIWDSASGRQLLRLYPSSTMSSKTSGQAAGRMQFRGRALFSPDGKLLAAMDLHGATVWDTGKWEKVIDLRLNTPVAQIDIAFSPDSKQLAFLSGMGDWSTVDVLTGRALPLTPNTKQDKYPNPTSLAWSPDAKYLAVAGTRWINDLGEVVFRKTHTDHWVRVYDRSSGQEVTTLAHGSVSMTVPATETAEDKFFVSNSTAIAFSPRGDLLAIGARGRIWLRATADWKELAAIEIQDSVGALRFSPDGNTLIASGNATDALFYVDIQQRKIVQKVDQGINISRWRVKGLLGVVSLMFDVSADGKSIVSARGNTIRIARGGQLPQFWRRLLLTNSELKIGKSGSYLIVRNSEDSFSVWDLNAGFLSNIEADAPETSSSSSSFLLYRTYPTLIVSFAEHGSELITWTPLSLKGDVGNLVYWDLASGRKQLLIENIPHPLISHPINADFLTPFHTNKVGRFFTSFRKDKFEVRRTSDGELIGAYRLPDDKYTSLHLSPTGQWAMASYFDTDGKKLIVLEVATGKAVTTISDGQILLEHFKLSGEGKIVFKKGTKGVNYSPSKNGLFDLPAVEWDFLTGSKREIIPDGQDQERNSRYWMRVYHWNWPLGVDDRNWNPTGGLSASSGRQFAACCTGGRFQITEVPSEKKRELPESFFRGGKVVGMAFVGDKPLLAVSVTDGSIRLLETENGKTLLTLYGLKGDAGGNDWLAVTPDGLFDGTPGGWDALLWRFSDELYDVAPGEAFFNEFYRPGLLAEIMAGARPKASRSLAEVDRRQPQVTLQVAGGAERQARVRIDVKEAPPGAGRAGGSGVRDVRLFRNGSLVKRWAGEVAGGADVLEASVPIIAGENRFTAYAFNRDNIKSGDARAQVTGADSLKRPATAWVLAFGINRYANRAFDLNFSVADAQAFAEQIGQGQTQLGRYQKVNLVSLKDAEATKANLLSALRRLSGKDSGPVPKGAPKALAELKPAQPEDAVFIFFAGHGLADGPRFYLVPHDLGYMGDPEQFDEKARATVFRHAVSDQELEAALESLDAERITLTIDACHSGQALEAEERRRGPMNSKGLAQLAYEKGMYVITAAQSHQAALEFGQLGHGLLTYALVKEGLAQGQADRQPQDGRVEVREWLDYASARVPQLQLEAMRATAQRGRNVAVVRGEEKLADVLQRTLQQPRVFYRREPERSPFVIGGGR